MRSPFYHPYERPLTVPQLFQNRNFKLLWIGQLLSQIGDQCLLVAVITLIARLTHSPMALLIPALTLAVPQLIFGLVGGAIADRWDRRATMITSDILRGFIVLIIILVTDVAHLWFLYLAVAGLSVVGVFFIPARNAAIPSIVSRDLLLTANAMMQSSAIISMILGPLVAGVAVEIWPPAAILLESLSYFISAGCIAAMTVSLRPPTSRAGREGSVWEDVKAGLVFIRRSRPLRQILFIMTIATLGIAAIVLLAVPHLQKELEAGGLEYGLAMSTLGLGAVLGGVLARRLSRRFSTGALVGGMLGMAGLAIIVFALAPNYLVVLLSIATLGACVVMARGTLDSLSLALSPDEMRGRVQAAANMLVAAATAVAQGLSATLGALIGVQRLFIAAGVLTTLTGGGAAFVLRSAVRAAGADSPQDKQDTE